MPKLTKILNFGAPRFFQIFEFWRENSFFLKISGFVKIFGRILMPKIEKDFEFLRQKLIFVTVLVKPFWGQNVGFLALKFEYFDFKVLSLKDTIEFWR